MKKSRFTEEQIAFALKQAETGTPVAEVLRRMRYSIRCQQPIWYMPTRATTAMPSAERSKAWGLP